MDHTSSTLLQGSRAYLSGPMDFVGSRIIEKYLGWRSIITPILEALGVVVLDPWNKPIIRGLDPDHEYGKEGVSRSLEKYTKDFWTNPTTRARYATDFWETVHIDLRLTDISDFMVAFVPTNVYSVGTVHEIITARQQKKPVLLVSPPVDYSLFPELDNLTDEQKGKLRYYGLKENPHGLPSQWYGYIVGGHYLYDGFGFEGLSLKSDTFYEDLIDAVMEQAKRNVETEQWDDVRDWLEQYEALQNLSGSVLDNIDFEKEEQELFMKDYQTEQEQNRHYYWFNKAYRPQRPVLYQLFSIASGYIPPKIRMHSSLDKEGNLIHESVKVKDDSWLLTSLAYKWEPKDTVED